MSQWALVIISYALTVAGTIGLAAASFASMRRAERAAEALKDRT
jgi:Flp pilus assembly protein CpaB